MRKYIVFVPIVISLLTGTAFAYSPPIGIPNPQWGVLHPIDTPSPAVVDKCPGWPSAATTGCYYIDPTHGASTDTSNTYGYPDKPRKTISGTTYPAGTYMFLGGQVSTYSTNFKFQGTEANPCWITSSAADQGGFSGGGGISLQGGTSYLFIENLLINNKAVGQLSTAVSISNTASTIDSANHISIRNNTIDNVQFAGDTAVFSTSARDGGSSHDIVFYNNHFTNVGDPYSLTDDDLLCISFGLRSSTQTTSYSYNLFALENSFIDTGSNGVQVNAWAGGNANLHHIYIGKNYGSNTRQKIIGIKQSSHVIVSQNDSIPGVNNAAGGVSESFGWSYGPDYVWYIFNSVHDGYSGVRPGDSTGSGGSDACRIFIIGNKFYDIRPELPYDPTNIWRFGTAIDLKQGSSTVHIVDNTFYNVYGGIIIKNADTKAYIHGNLFSGIQPTDTFIDIASTADYSLVRADNNLYYDSEGDGRWRVNSVDYTSQSAWESAYPLLSSNSLYSEPTFVNASAKNFRPALGSPAINAGTTSPSLPDVYATFQTLYGLDIRKDITSTARPVGPAWDIGAYESTDGVTVPIKVRGFRVRVE